MNTPFDPTLWQRLQDRGAAALPFDFPDRVLRTLRLASGSEAQTWKSHPFTISAVTAALCLGIVMLFHAQQNQSASALHLAAWEDISQQTASIEPAP